MVEAGDRPEAAIAVPRARDSLPWAGRFGTLCVPWEVRGSRGASHVADLRRHRSRAEVLFHALSHYNDTILPITFHHGSLDVGQRRSGRRSLRDPTPSCPPLSISASTGRTSISSSMSAHREGAAAGRRIDRGDQRLDQPTRHYCVLRTRFEVLRATQRSKEAAEGRAGHPAVGGIPALRRSSPARARAVTSSEPFDPDALFCGVTSASAYSG